MFQNGDLLSRSQLKKVLGGDGGYSGGGGGYGGSGGGGGGGGSTGIICEIRLIEDGGHGSGHYSNIDGTYGTAAAQSFCNNAVALNPGWVCSFTCS